VIIILEGADGVGKTTAAAMIKRVIQSASLGGVALFHRGPPERDPLLEYTVDLEGFTCDKTYKWAVCDRWHWGELIYGPLYRGESLLSGAGHRAVDEFLARRGAIVVHLDARVDVIVQRVVERGDDYVLSEHLPFIVEEYRRIREMHTPLQRYTMVDFDEGQARYVVNLALRVNETTRSAYAHRH
jgi:thymidylate kinase